VSEAADFETLLRRAFAPVDPPADLSDRLEQRLTRITELAVDELEQWELQAMRDPRNWTGIARPIAAGAIAAGAGTALVLLRARRSAKRSGVRRMLLR
jgi:uncharacterized protein (DUF2062 family)